MPLADTAQPSPIRTFLGAEIEAMDAGRGWSKVRFSARPEFLNPAGVVQGGMLCAMIDHTIGPLLVAHSQGRCIPSTIDLHVHFLKPVPLGPVTVEAQVTQMGKTIAYAEAKLYSAGGELAARGVTSCRMKSLSPA